MKQGSDFLVVGLGELLWDELPSENGGVLRRLGGAPANFAVMSSRLGVHGVLASRLGTDELGRAALELLNGLVGRPGSSGVDTRFLQADPDRATGTVTVAVEHGQPQYTIHAPAAWDALELTPEWTELAARADAVCWGTLAQRDAHSEQTIHSFLAATRPECLRIFDVNLREPYITAEAVERSLTKATLLKLNDGEMPHLLSLAQLPAATEYADGDDAARTEALTRGAQQLLIEYDSLDRVAITLGPDGSLLVSRDSVLRHRGVPAKVVDTVGAGDAWTAALAVYILLGASPAVQSEAANQWGAWVAGQSGAMPELTAETLIAMETKIREGTGG